MDPVTAVGLASNIFQLIGVARGVALTTRDLYKSKNGLSKEIDRFRIQAELVHKHLDELTRGTSTKPDDVALREYAQAMCTRTTEYLATLDRVKIRDTSSWWNAFGAAVKSWWKKEQFAESFKAIEEAGTNITTHIVTTKIPAMQVDISRIHKHTLLMEANVEEKMQELCSQIRENTVVTKSHGNDILRAVEKWLETQEKAKNQRECLQALYFPQIQNRWNEVKDAHAKTFDWIFGDAEPAPNLPLDLRQVQSPEFKQWLHSQDSNDNIFWISGKPGSGKSTLMKYLIREERLREHLGGWIGNKRLIVADCFFWKYGSRLQRSLVGLLRSLLYYILKQCPELVSTAFPNPEWVCGGPAYEFPLETLVHALKDITESLGNSELRLFVMVDGLDEFDDKEDRGPSIHDQRELVDLLRVFCGKDAIKLCVSSRPLPLFRQEFGRNESRCICMQDLTASDIFMYTEEELEKNPTIQHLILGGQGYAKFTYDIVQAAQGVFLWVRLAVRSLLQGISNEDSITTLEARLRVLPQELEDLYLHILDSIEPIYQSSSALMLLTHVCPGPNISRYIPLIHNYMDEEKYRLSMQTEKFELSQLTNIQDSLRARINVHCGGLLEHTKPSGTRPYHGKRVVSIGWGEGALDRFLTGGIESCHKSTSDFLAKSEIKHLLLVKAKLSWKQLYLRFLKSCIAVLHALLRLDCDKDTASRYFTELIDTLQGLIVHFFWAADHLETNETGPLIAKFEHLLLQPMSRSGRSLLHHVIDVATFCYFRKKDRHFQLPESNVLYVLAFRGCGMKFIKSKIAHEPGLVEVDDCGFSLLYLACLRWKTEPSADGMVRMLMKHGSNPNQPVHGSTPWQRWLTEIFARFAGPYHHLDWDQKGPVFRETVQNFIRHGANLDITCYFIAHTCDDDITAWRYGGKRRNFGRLVVHPSDGCELGTSVMPELEEYPNRMLPFELPAGDIARYLYHANGAEASAEMDVVFHKYKTSKEVDDYLEECRKGVYQKYYGNIG
jgi:hypothetical protein